MEMLTAKVLVLGGGPGGYVAAIRCGQAGLDTIIVEAGRLGGTCLTRGCIPSKALIHAADEYDMMRSAAREPRFGIRLAQEPEIDYAATINWKDGIVDQLSGGVQGLLRRAKVRHIEGWGRFLDGKTCVVAPDRGREMTIKAEHVILATGSEPVELPHVPFGGPVISSTEALSLTKIPQRLAIIGAGYIGVELGTAFRKLGSEVTIIEQSERILPAFDAALVEPVRKALDTSGVTTLLGARVEGFDIATCSIRVMNADGAEQSIAADKVLVTVGRKPVVDGWGLEEMSVAMNGRFVAVDERCATSMHNIWAIGDLVGEPLLAHKASAQGEMVAEIIAGRRRRFDPVAIPAVCFTEPEIVTVGLAPADEAARELGVAEFPFRANGRALTLNAGAGGGFVRIVYDKSNHVIMGIQAVGRQVAEMAGEFALAVEMRALLEDIAGVIHVHPTLGEAFHEGALRGLGHALHV